MTATPTSWVNGISQFYFRFIGACLFAFISIGSVINPLVIISPHDQIKHPCIIIWHEMIIRSARLSGASLSSQNNNWKISVLKYKPTRDTRARKWKKSGPERKKLVQGARRTALELLMTSDCASICRLTDCRIVTSQIYCTWYLFT
jgi:hypothetical protein